MAVKTRSLGDSVLFKSYVDPETLETTCSDKRVTKVFRTLDDDQMNHAREEYYVVDREIDERQRLINAIKRKFSDNIEPETLLDHVTLMIKESKKLTNSGISKLVKDKEELSVIVETGQRPSEEMVFMMNNATKMKTAYYDISGNLIEVRDSSEGDVNIFSNQ
jgi:hypothetical protein